MMKLRAIEWLDDTVDSELHSPISDRILQRWGYEPHTAQYFRSSANHIFHLDSTQDKRWLRFVGSDERKLEHIEAEIEVLRFLKDRSLRVAQPLPSLSGRYVETIETEAGRFYAVLFDGLEDKQYGIEDLPMEGFANWGKSLGQLHEAMKQIPQWIRDGRPEWQDQLSAVQRSIAENNRDILRELTEVLKWMNTLPVNDAIYGLVHYDFELDNLLWDGNSVGIVDFDGCVNLWYVSDIAYALRDLFEDDPNRLNIVAPRSLSDLHAKLVQVDDRYLASLGEKH